MAERKFSARESRSPRFPSRPPHRPRRPQTLRAELAAFTLAPSASSTREGDEVAALAPEHRPGLVPLLIRLLYPKMRKRSGRLGGKGGWRGAAAGRPAKAGGELPAAACGFARRLLGARCCAGQAHIARGW